MTPTRGMGNNAIDLLMNLKDGRHLGFAEYGAPHGKPVLFFMDSPAIELCNACRDIFMVNPSSHTALL